jgi:malonate-semialdehyde dehydrogenase (acetylating) / methylmalonate-semialdehyde dehydrogenase
MSEVIEAAGPRADEATAPRRISHWIGGMVVAGESGRSGPVFNPATGEQTGEVDFATVEEVDRAVAAAAEAFPTWRALSLSKRTELFFRIRSLVYEHREDVARFLTLEHGKVLSDALGEVARGLEVIEYCCGIPELLKGDFSEQASTGIDVYSIRQPVGVCAGITPFNFPAMVPMWMWAPALACGNTFVLKPSEKDPSASMYVAELLREAGVPDGVFNVVHGDKVAVDAILEHPGIGAVSFVGSTPIAKYVYETATKHGKRCQALGGAKNHMIVLPDADVEMAADAAVSAAYGSAGERCMAISQVVAVGDVGDRLIAAIKDRIPNVKVGDGLDPESEMGPLVTREHRDRVASYVEGAPEEGATVVVDGRESAPDGDGFWLGVSLLDNVTPDMRAYQDEIFGPVLGVTRVETYDDAVRLVNENQYGNGTAIFTRDGGVARQFQFDVQAGMVGINVPIPVPVAYYSFGGWKASLFGDTHVYGPEGINFYTRRKVVTSRWPDPATSRVDLGFPQTR